MNTQFNCQAIQFSQKVLIQPIQFSINIDFLQTIKSQKILYLKNQFNVNTVLMSKNNFISTTQFSIQKQFHFKQFSLM